VTCNLYLVRHGEVFNPNHVVYGDLPGFHLSAIGVQQVHCTGVHLRRTMLDLIVSSPLDRARESSAAIARHHAVDSVIDDRLTESGQFPHWTGHRWEAIPDLFPQELAGYLADASRVETSERLSEVAARYRSVVEEAVARGHTGIVIVGHQDPVQAIRLSLTGRPLGELRLDPPVHGEVFTLSRSDGRDWIERSRWSPPASA
jgi:broad specificity phosphatase PhoE